MGSFRCREVWHKIFHVRLPVSIKKTCFRKMQAFLVQRIVNSCYGSFLTEIRFDLCSDLIVGHLVTGVHANDFRDECF
jgi:hypothetical protein